MLAKPLKRWRRMDGNRWHERLVEVRRYVADLERKELLEQLAETWPPEVRAGYHRELCQLIDQLTSLARRLEGMSPMETSEGDSAKHVRTSFTSVRNEADRVGPT